jgi:predicted nucleic acid-binding protein
MVKALFDTNILIDFLNGVTQARDELALYADKAISIISWMEVMAGADATVEEETRAFLKNFELVPLEQDVAERAVHLRRAHRLKLPDAIVLASAETGSRLLVTRDRKDFSANSPGVRVPYQLGVSD